MTEFLDCKTKGALGPTPYLVGEVGEKLALLHMRSEGFSTTYGFDCDTYVGFQKQDNTRRSDFSDFLVTNRLEPQVIFPTPHAQSIVKEECTEFFCFLLYRQLSKATKELRSKWKRSQEGRRLCKELDEMAFKVVDRLTDSYIWNECEIRPPRFISFVELSMFKLGETPYPLPCSLVSSPLVPPSLRFSLSLFPSLHLLHFPRLKSQSACFPSDAHMHT